jgi:hypothetical protein
MAVITLEIDDGVMAFLEHNAEFKEFPGTREYIVHVMRLGVLQEFGEVWERAVRCGPDPDQTERTL